MNLEKLEKTLAAQVAAGADYFETVESLDLTFWLEDGRYDIYSSLCLGALYIIDTQQQELRIVPNDDKAWEFVVDLVWDGAYTADHIYHEVCAAVDQRCGIS